MANIDLGTVQFCGNTDPNANDIQVSVTIGAGDTIWIGAEHNTTGFVSSSLSIISGPSTPTPTQIGTTVNDTGGAQGYEHFYVQNPGAGTYTFQYSSVDVAGARWLDLFAVAVINGELTGILVANGPGQYQNASTTLDSGTAQNPGAGNYPALVCGFSVDSQVTETPAVASGYTDNGSGFGFFGFGNGGRVESKRITSGTAQAQFTVAAASDIVTMMACFKERQTATRNALFFFGSGFG